MRRYAYFCLLTSASFMACFSSLDGLEGPAAVAPALPPEAGTPDEGTTNDGGLPDAAFSRFSCSNVQPTPLFCNDFEGADDLSKFDSPGKAGNGTVTVVDPDDASPSRALLSTIPAITVDGGAKAFGMIAIQGPLDTVRLSFDVFVEKPAAGASVVHVCSFTLGPVSVTISADRGALTFSNTATNFLAGSLFDAWHHVDVIFDLSGPNPTQKVSVDGIQAPLSSPPGGPSSKNVTLRVGIYYGEPNDGPWRVHTDNIVLTRL